MFQEQDETVVDSAETTTQDGNSSDYEQADSESESEASETTESVEQRKTETPEQRRARIKRQYEREFGKQGDKGGQESTKESSKEVNGDERYTRLELKTEGVTSKKAQDVVIEYIKEAKLIGKEVDIATALKSNVVKEAIAEIERKTSVPPPSNRTTQGASDSFEYWVGQAKKGHFPTHDSVMMDKLKKARIFTS
jgi:hypothetical protein